MVTARTLVDGDDDDGESVGSLGNISHSTEVIGPDTKGSNEAGTEGEEEEEGEVAVEVEVEAGVEESEEGDDIARDSMSAQRRSDESSR